MDTYLFKLNGWPDTYDERIRAIAQTTDIVFIRSAPRDDADKFEDMPNVSIYNVYPRRGSYVKPSWIRPIVFSLHVWQAIFLAVLLPLFRECRPDVAHGMDYVLGGFAATVVSKIHRCGLVLSVRGYKEPTYRSFLEEEQTLRARINYWILVTLSRMILSQADHVITKAEYQRQAVVESTGVNPGFTTLPTGVDFDRFDPAKVKSNYLDQLFPATRFSDSDFRLLYFGQLIPQKGLDTILRHLSASDLEPPDGFMFVIIGEFRSTEYQEEIEQLADKCESPVIIHPSKIPFDDVPDLLRSVDCVSLLSEPGHEGVPRVLQESCAMQVPIIASDVTGISKAFKDLPGCYLIDRDDPDTFVEVLNNISNAPPEMERDIFCSKFDMYENYRKYGDVYRELVNNNRTQNRKM